MALEIERKFLVWPDLLPPLEGGTLYIQGYLSAEPQVRFRIEPGRTVLCVKKARAAGERIEVEFPRRNVPDADNDLLRDCALWPPLEKTRHRIAGADGRVWELDVYGGANAGLITAEVELPARDTPIAFPPWVRDAADITADGRYANINLTRRPFREWPAHEQAAALQRSTDRQDNGG